MFWKLLDDVQSSKPGRNVQQSAVEATEKRGGTLGGRKLKIRIVLIPFMPALLMGLWAGLVSKDLSLAVVQFTLFFVGSSMALLFFGLPLILVFRKLWSINLLNCILISALSAEFMIGVILRLTVGPYRLGSITLMDYNLMIMPAALSTGVGLWYVGFKEYGS